MSLVTLADVRSAATAIAGRVHRTPLVHSSALSAMTGLDLWLKLEPMQKTGSFKVRGALNRVNALTAQERQNGVVTMSAGNHAQGLAFAATAVGVKSVFVMPANAVKSKVEATRGYGGEVFQTDGDLLTLVKKLQADRGLVFVPPFDDPHIIAGAGTVTDEILDDLPDVDAIVCSIGGGGLVSGMAVVARARRPDARIIGIEPDGACAMRQSLDRGEPVYLNPPPKTLADGLAAPFAGAVTLAHVRELGVEVYVLPDKPIIDAMWLLMERAKIVTEPAASAGLAGLLAGIAQPALPKGARVVVIVSGGNVDAERLKMLA